MERKALVAANWKMNGSAELAAEIIHSLAGLTLDCEILICPPATLLHCFTEQDFCQIGGQTLSEHQSGAYTGELSAALLLASGANYVLVGHSERRQYQLESDELICRKVQQAIAAGLTPVLCVGETLTERRQQKTEQVIAKQLAAVYAALPELLHKSVIAYEPVWAIGTGESATPEQAQETHAFIRQQLMAYQPTAAKAVRILYGGSVNAGNSAALFTQTDIDGALVGGASLKPAEFAHICISANSTKD